MHERMISCKETIFMQAFFSHRIPTPKGEKMNFYRPLSAISISILLAACSKAPSEADGKAVIQAALGDCVEFRPKLTQGFHPKLTRVNGAQYT
jgi:hypothetical protein